MLLQRITRYLILSILFAVLSAAALAFLPLCNMYDEKTENILSTICAAAFWLFLFLEQCFFWVADAGRRKVQKRAFEGRLIVKHTLGLVTFGSNREACASDAVLFAALISTICLVAYEIKNIWPIAGVLALLILSFTLHCIFNGTTYRYIKAFHNIKKEPKKYEST